MALRHPPHRSHYETSRTCSIDCSPLREAPASSRMLRALPPQAESDYVHVFATASADQNPLAVNSCLLRQLSTPSSVDKALLHGCLISAKPIVTDRRRRLRMCVTDAPSRYRHYCHTSLSLRAYAIILSYRLPSSSLCLVHQRSIKPLSDDAQSRCRRYCHTSLSTSVCNNSKL